MNLAHRIGEQKCSLYTEDISQKSSHLLRLKLILNGLVHSIPNVVQGNTILHPAHRAESGGGLRQFDYIVSNPPFKLDFSDFRDQLETKANASRFFAGIPKMPNKKKESMAIYLCFIQHIIRTFNAKEAVDDFSVAVSYDDIAAKNHSLSAGQYFEVKIEYVDITPEAFQAKLAGHQERLQNLFQESKTLETEIESHLGQLQLEPEMGNR